MGDGEKASLRLQFNPKVRLAFHGATITTDAGLLAFREFDDALGLTEIAEDYLQESRTGRNILHHLVPLLRQSIYSRLAGYDDTNDAVRLSQDPAMRVIVGWQGSERKGASTSEMGRFETEFLTQEDNRQALARMNTRWVERAMAHTLHQRVILDMDSSESPVHGQQEGAAYNGHFECVCYHPLFLFNQFGDCEGAKLRSGNVHSADDWQEVLDPVVERYFTAAVRLLFRADAAFAKPEIYEYLETRQIDYAIRLPANEVLQRKIAHLLTRPTEGPSPKPIVSYHDFTYQAQSWNVSRRVVAKVEWHQGELFPRVGFIVTNLSYPTIGIVRFYNGRGTAEQWIKEAEKPFAPLIAYDSQERTLVMSPLNHYLVSPMRLLKTPDGTAVARGLHGSVNVIAEGMTTRTLLTFGTGMVSTVLKWGELLTRSSGKEPGGRWDSLAVRTLGFWNCYGGYYAELFRQTNAVNLSQLSQHFTEVDLPVRYWGLDLWYQFHTVGFAARYLPDPIKYPHGLKELFETTGIPFMLHMSAFDRDNHYLDSHDFAVGEGSAYPAGPELYRELALEFKNWGATGIWHDFLRVQMQNCRSLRDQVGLADQWFDNLATATSEQGLDVMLCMPTIGHYLASAAHDNVVAVRTSTDYVNHQPGQLELLSRLDEYRSGFSPQGNLRQNLMLSFLAGALGLAPSHDVFISNREHPEGFANPHAERDALMRALSAGIVGLGDKLGFVDREVAGKLAFPDGSLAQPGHPLYPVASSLQSDVPTFYTGTFISGYRWTYLVLVNLTEDTAEYRLDLEPLLLGNECMVYDYHAGEVVTDRMIAGQAQPGEGRYLIVVPKVAGIYPLGFPDKYVTLPKRQVKEIRVRPEGVTIDLELPVERKYTFAVVGTDHLSATGQGIKVESVETRGELTCIEFMVDSPRCSLLLQS